MSINLPTGGAFLPLAGGTLTGSVTFADGAVWASTGLSSAASYTTSSTSIIAFGPTWNFSTTSNGFSSIAFTPTLVPTGATAGNINGFNLGTTVGTSAVNGGTFRGSVIGLTVAAGYSGVLTETDSLQVNSVNNGTNPVATVKTISANAPTNGNGITSGSVTNNVFFANTGTMAAGVGGTVVNNAGVFSLSSGSSAGTTNRGLYITGNGGGASTNYAILSDSTAPSSLAGNLSLTKDTSLFFTNQTSGAAGNTGTLLNAPAAGNPHIWIPVSVNGTAGWVPWWHA